MSTRSFDEETSLRAERLEPTVFLITRVLIIVCFGIALASVFFITQEWDEAIIYGTLKQGLSGSWHPLGLRAPTATGGLHSLVQGVVYVATGPDLIFVRFASILYLLALAKAISTLFDLPKEMKEGSLLLFATVLAVPGVFFHSVLSFAVVLATALFFVTLKVWVQYPAGSYQRRLYTGLLLGLTVATRLNFLLAVPLFSMAFSGTGKRHNLKDGIVIGSIAIGTFLLSALVLQLATQNSLDRVLYDLSLSVGVWNRSPQEWGKAFEGEGFSLLGLIRPATWLNRWKLANQLFPFPMLAISTAYAWLPLKNRTQRDAIILRIIAVHSWLGWLAWIVVLPLPYLRYLLPSLIGFSVILGHLMVQLYMLIKQHRRSAAIVIPVFAMASLVNCTLMSARQLLLGDSRRIVSEFAGSAGPTIPFRQGLFVAAAEERQLADFVRDHLDDQLPIAVAIREHVQLMYSTGKKMMTLAEAIDQKVLPHWIIAEGRIISPPVHRLLQSGYLLVKQFDSYSVYEVRQSH